MLEPEDSLHILILPSWYPSPSNPINGSFFKEQALALQRHGFKVGVLYVHLESAKKIMKLDFLFQIRERTRDEIPTLECEGIRIPYCQGLNRRIRCSIGLRMFRRYIRLFGIPDLVHVQAMEHAGPLALSIKERYGIPYIVTEHSSKFVRNLIGSELHQALSLVVRGSSRLIAVSREFCRLLEGFFNMDQGSWKYIPNIVNEKFLRHSATKAGCSNKTRFISVALLTRIKGIDLLLEAFSVTFLNNDSVELVIVGDGDQRSALEHQAEALGIKNKVSFKGLLSRGEVLDEISQSDVLVVSSLHETFGMVLIEALALGKPVLATRCGGPESIVEPGDGLLVDRGSAIALSDGLAKMWRSLGTFDSEGIRSRCEARFSEDVVLGALSKVYNETVGDIPGKDGSAEPRHSFSVVVPLYNKERHVERAVRSAQGQTFPPLEIIVVDDGSTDGGAGIVEKLAVEDRRIRLIRQENGGVSRARNAGIAAARGTHVAFLDADDEWKPDYLGEIFSLIRRFPNAGSYSTAYEIAGAGGKKKSSRFLSLWPGRFFLFRNYFRASFRGSIIWTSATVVPKSTFKKSGVFLDGAGRGQDLDLWWRIGAWHDVAYSRSRKAIYYTDADNRSDQRLRKPSETTASGRWWAVDRLEALSRDDSIRPDRRKWILELVLWYDILAAYDKFKRAGEAQGLQVALRAARGRFCWLYACIRLLVRSVLRR